MEARGKLAKVSLLLLLCESWDSTQAGMPGGRGLCPLSHPTSQETLLSHLGLRSQDMQILFGM